MKRLQDMYGDEFHPIMSMAENAVKLQKAADEDPNTQSYKAALEGWEKIAKYVEPQLKAIEVTGEDGEAIKTETTFKFVPVNSK